MKFRTEITPSPLRRPIGWQERILAVGSCFAEEIARRLAASKFHIVINPSGVLFNPASIARAMERWSREELFDREEVRCSVVDGQRWFHYDLHGSFSEASPEALLRRAESALRAGSQALREADRVLVTFGTAWVYELRETGCVVANCHRQPRDLFTRRRLSVEEIVAQWSLLIEGPLRGKQVLMTLSPIRHLADGAEENSLSKATLRLAIAELCDRFPEVEYFPAYELLMDDLRDYRFYGEDLVHPSSQAADYVWEKFAEAALDPALREALPRLEEIRKAMAHRPLHPESEAYRAFCSAALRKVLSLEEIYRIDLSEEKAFFAEKID